MRSWIVGGTILMVCAFIALAIESKGRLVESRVGFIALVVIAALIFLSAYVTPKNQTNKTDKTKPDEK